MTEEVLEIIKETTPVMGPPAPLECAAEIVTETGFPLWYLYTTVLDWFLPVMMIIGGYIILRHLIWGSLLFNYHYYLQYGTFVLLWGDDSDPNLKERRIDLSKELKIQADFAAWYAALAMTLFIVLVCLVISYLWPITIILVIPLLIVRLIGYRKRQKINFTQKLKGDHLKDQK